MPSLTEIRAGLKTNLSALDGCQVSGYMLDDPTPPSLMVVGPDDIEYDLAMRRGLDVWTIVVQGFAGAPNAQRRQEIIDGWLEGDQCVKDAIEADVTLGGIVPGCRVTKVEAYRNYVLPNGRELFGGQWFVEVHNTV